MNVPLFNIFFTWNPSQLAQNLQFSSMGMYIL